MVQKNRRVAIGSMITVYNVALWKWNYILIRCPWLMLFYICMNSMLTNNTKKFRIKRLHLRSNPIRMDLLLYESKLTEKREQYDWRAEKNLAG